MFSNNEDYIGVFSGVVACILMLALTAMAFRALDPPRQGLTATLEISQPEPSAPAATPTFGY